MKRYLKRQVYEQMFAWKQQPGHSTLEVSGARQVGKTYIVNKFAEEQYKNKIYINLLDFSGELFMERYDELRQEIKDGLECENPVYELIKRYRPKFVDSPETVVIIDEIQESAAIYNRIREFTRTLKSDFIVTRSYLGRILNKEFKFSAGDLDTVEVQTLSFKEFLIAMGCFDLYEELDIYGGSEERTHYELRELYRTYTAIGGYPAVVLQYMESHSLPECEAVLLKIIKLFIQESRRYFADILDDEVYQNIFSCVARILVKEKKGFDKDSFSEELRSIVVKDYSSNVSKATVNRAIDWLYSSGIIGFAGKIPECSIMDFKAKARCYFMDLGIANFYLRHIGCPKGHIAGIISENFVFLDLKRRLGHPSEITLETPAFATLGNGEIDFWVMAMHSQKTYAIEVKSGKNNSKTIQEALNRKKIDFALFVKGNTYGGIKDNILTIPIYGISKFSFE